MAFNVINALRGAGAAISNAANKAVTKPVSTALSTAGTIAKVVPNPLTPVVNIAKLATPEKTTSLSGTPTSTPTTAPATTTTTVKGGMSTQSPQGGGMSTVGITKVPSAPSAPQVSNSYQAPAFSASDFTSTDQSIQQRIQDMQKQAQGSSSQSYQAPTQPQSPIAPSTPTANAVSAPQSNSVIDQLRGKINALSAPSAEEQSLQQELAQLRGDAAQGIAGLEGQGRGIPLTLVRGQQAKLGEQAQLQEQTLLDRITAMSAQRQAQLQAAQNEYTMAEAEQARQDRLTAPTTVGNQILQFDPATGQYKTLYSAPEQAAELPATAQEYEYAKSQGYTGSFLDYQTAKNAASSSASGGFNLSPGQVRYDAQGNVIASAPESASTKAPTQAQSAAATYAERIAQAEDTLSSNSFYTDIRYGTPMAEVLKSQDRKLAEQAEANFINAVLRRESGAAISPSEFASARKQYIPQPGDGPDVLAQKAQNRAIILQGLQNEAGSAAFSANGAKDDPLGLGFNNVGGDTNQAVASQLSAYDGKKAGECGHFVNQMTGLKMGDSIESKLAYADKSIGTAQNPVRPGDVFIMPYSWTGHTGIVADGEWIPKEDGTYDIPVTDSNFHLDGKVDTHYINSSKMAGFVRVPLKTNFQYA